MGVLSCPMVIWLGPLPVISASKVSPWTEIAKELVKRTWNGLGLIHSVGVRERARDRGEGEKFKNNCNF